jgi:hypothetical protein
MPSIIGTYYFNTSAACLVIRSLVFGGTGLGNPALVVAACLRAVAYSRNCRVFVGSYGTRNVVGIRIISYWERPTDCIVLYVSKFSSPVGVLLSRGLA